MIDELIRDGSSGDKDKSTKPEWGFSLFNGGSTSSWRMSTFQGGGVLYALAACEKLVKYDIKLLCN